MLAIIGRQVGVMSNWFVQSPMIRDLAEETVMDQLLMISVLLLCCQHRRQVGVMSNWFVQSQLFLLQKKQLMDQLLMISVLLLLDIIGNRLGLCLIGLFKVEDTSTAEETVDGSAFDDFKCSSIRETGLVMSNWFVQSLPILAKIEETVKWISF